MELVRPNYFNGQLLTAADLQLEQQYWLKKTRLLNRCLIGSGTVCGLKVTLGNGNPPELKVAPGMAIDNAGNLIVVPESATVGWSLLPESKVGYVVLRYAETAFGEVPCPAPVTDPDSQNSKPTRIKEGFEIAIEEQNPATNEPTDCLQDPAQPRPVPLARLRRVGRKWTLDRSFRQPRCK
jgi:hypothetical protein